MKRVCLSVRLLLPAGASLLLGWLGFANYDSIGMAEYGTPIVDCGFKVRATNQDTKPVESPQVNLPNGRRDKKKLTDAQGSVELEGSYTGFRGGHGVALEMKDIGDERSGVVADKQVIVGIKESDFVSKGPGNWSNGKVKKDIEIQMERK